jgi:hypothetical protein
MIRNVFMGKFPELLGTPRITYSVCLGQEVPLDLCLYISKPWYLLLCNARFCNIIRKFMVLCFRLNRRDIEHLISLAESFTWKKMPIRDPYTGNLTMSGYILRVNSLTKFIWTFLTVYHSTQSAFRMLTSHSMIFTTWYPFDASVSPLYEIVNFSQVNFLTAVLNRSGKFSVK